MIKFVKRLFGRTSTSSPTEARGSLREFALQKAESDIRNERISVADAIEGLMFLDVFTKDDIDAFVARLSGAGLYTEQDRQEDMVRASVMLGLVDEEDAQALRETLSGTHSQLLVPCEESGSSAAPDVAKSSEQSAGEASNLDGYNMPFDAAKVSWFSGPGACLIRGKAFGSNVSLFPRSRYAEHHVATVFGNLNQGSFPAEALVEITQRSPTTDNHRAFLRLRKSSQVRNGLFEFRDLPAGDYFLWSHVNGPHGCVMKAVSLAASAEVFVDLSGAESCDS